MFLVSGFLGIVGHRDTWEGVYICSLAKLSANLGEGFYEIA